MEKLQKCNLNFTNGKNKSGENVYFIGLMSVYKM